MVTRVDEAADGSWRDVLERVRAAVVAAGEQDPLDEAARLRLKHRGLADSTLWLAGPDGSPDGFALAHDGAVDLAVAPEARGRGLGRELAAVALAGDAPLTAWSHSDHPAAAALAAAHRLRRARELWVMRRPTALPLPDLAVPDGITVRGYRAEDRDEVLRVNAAAFSHHPEQGSMDAEDLAARMSEAWFDPAGLLVAEDAAGSGGLSAFHWTKQHDARLGEVYVVAVDPAAQGRGLGRVVTLAGLHHLRGLGVAEVLLYVESDNAPAVRVYSGLGFTHADADTHVQYRRG